MSVHIVNLGKIITQEQLEDILIKAGKNMNWKPKRVICYTTEYSLDRKIKGNKTYNGEDIVFKGAFLPVLKAEVFHGSHFDRLGGVNMRHAVKIRYGFSENTVGLKVEVEKFLTYLQKHIAEIPTYQEKTLDYQEA